MKCATVEPTTNAFLDPRLIAVCAAPEKVPMWVLRHDPAGGLIARLWTNDPEPLPTDFVLTGKDKTAIEDVLFKRFHAHWRWVDRDVTDEPAVVGVWL